MIGLGTFPLTGDVLSTTIKDAVDLGYELFDTATGYDNEQELGELVGKGVLDPKKVFITSKIHSSVLLGRKRYLYLNRKSVKRAYKESCEKLQTQKIGAYLLPKSKRGKYVFGY